MSVVQRIKNGFARAIVPNPPGVRGDFSLIFYDDHGAPTDQLFDVALAAIQHARTEDLSEIAARMPAGERWPDIWPGEHYKLLAGLVHVLKPAIVIEIGTYQGLSALTLAKRLPAGSTLHTFDIMPYSKIPGCVFRESDFDGRIKTVVADLTAAGVFDTHRALFESADLIFVDAAKDGVMEQTFLDRFETVRFRKPPLVVFDDIRVWNMLKIWRGVRRPKLDLTSFGHWSGTGIIDWVEGGPMNARPAGSR